jgi:hypothetical protein
MTPAGLQDAVGAVTPLVDDVDALLEEVGQGC